MVPSVLKGMAVGIALILTTVFIGMMIGFACSGGDYEVDSPGESDHYGQIEQVDFADIAGVEG